MPSIGKQDAGKTERDGQSSFYYANKMGRIIFLALEETAGAESMRAILAAARMTHRIDQYPTNDFDREFPFEELGRIQQATEELYGPGTARRLARGVGRACFRVGAQDLRPVLGIADLVVRVLPLRVRLRIGFDVLAQMFDRFSDHRAQVEEDEDYFRWTTRRCGVCWGRSTAEPCCDLVVGLLEEGIRWLTGGARFFIEESSCVAAGDEVCTILIGKSPLGTTGPAAGSEWDR